MTIGGVVLISFSRESLKTVTCQLMTTASPIPTWGPEIISGSTRTLCPPCQQNSRFRVGVVTEELMMTVTVRDLLLLPPPSCLTWASVLPVLWVAKCHLLGSVRCPIDEWLPPPNCLTRPGTSPPSAKSWRIPCWLATLWQELHGFLLGQI